MKMLKSLFIILILIGVGVSSYLTFLHYSQIPAVCGVSEIFASCDSVLSSKYSKLFGIPVALLGVFFYIATLFVFIFLISKKKKIFLTLLLLLESTGLIFSIIFTYLQFFVIKTLCPYCLTSALVTFLLFSLSFYFKNNTE